MYNTCIDCILQSELGGTQVRARYRQTIDKDHHQIPLNSLNQIFTPIHT